MYNDRLTFPGACSFSLAVTLPITKSQGEDLMEQDTVNFRLILIDKNPGLDRSFSTGLNASSGSTTDSDDEMNGPVFEISDDEDSAADDDDEDMSGDDDDEDDTLSSNSDDEDGETDFSDVDAGESCFRVSPSIYIGSPLLISISRPPSSIFVSVASLLPGHFSRRKSVHS